MATKKSRWAGAATIVASCLLLGGAGAVVSGIGPGFFDHTAPEAFCEASSSQTSAGPGPPFMLSQDLPRTHPHTLGISDPSALARYDNIMVEVNRDGSLCVLGEQMGVNSFRNLLLSQMQIQLRTLVTIQPDANCPFRHVGSVLAVCEEAGVLHHTQTTPAAVSVRGPTAEPT